MENGNVSRFRGAATSSAPPGPRTPALIQGLRQLRDPLGFVPKIQHRYGDVFTVSLPVLGKVVYLTSPEAVKAVFTGSPAQIHSGEVMAAVLEPSVGTNSVLTLDDAPHMRQRKLLLPPFHGERVKRYGELIREVTLEEMESWPVGKPFALYPHFQRIALAVIMKSVFGVHDVERLDRIEQLIETFQKRVPLVSLFPALRHDFGPWSPWARFLRARQALDELIYEVIELCREQKEERDDVLSLLMSARDDDGAQMSDKELRDELAGIVGAGYETTTNLLSWTVERLLRTPRALTCLRDSIAAGEDDYLTATVKEALRARPVVTSLARKLTAPTQIGGFDLEAGTIVLPAIAALHYREDLFPQPQEFRPERFLDGGKKESYAWIPFGGGVRRCIGAAFAEYEMRTVLRTVFERADLRAPDQEPERVKLRTVTLTPGKGTRVILNQPLH
ncbi:MAG TPA: cytochrome P450 [Solirubrobacterales bacterium]|nr:cytochrome P450 [Solirubrobacterales bacterium]